MPLPILILLSVLWDSFSRLLSIIIPYVLPALRVATVSCGHDLRDTLVLIRAFSSLIPRAFKNTKILILSYLC